MTHQWQRLALVAGVDVHLPAAGLLRREDHLVTQPLQQRHRRLAHLREQRVAKAGHEQRDPHADPMPSSHVRKPDTGKIAVKVINDYGDEVMKIFEV